MADMMVQMKIPTETKAIDRYLLAEYLQKKKHYNKQAKPLGKCVVSRFCGCQRRHTYLFFRMTIPRIMLAISDPCEGINQRSADQTEGKVTVEAHVRGKADKRLLI